MLPSDSPDHNQDHARVQFLYQAHAELPYISPERNLTAWLEDLDLGKKAL